jgi:hypothetical protein
MADPGAKGASVNVLYSKASVFRRHAVRVECIPLRSQYGDGLRYGIPDAAKLHFILPQLLFRLLPVVDIGVISVPSENVSDASNKGQARLGNQRYSPSNLLTRVSVSNGFPSVTGKAKSCHNEYFGVVQPWQ